MRLDLDRPVAFYRSPAAPETCGTRTRGDTWQVYYNSRSKARIIRARVESTMNFDQLAAGLGVFETLGVLDELGGSGCPRSIYHSVPQVQPSASWLQRLQWCK